MEIDNRNPCIPTQLDTIYFNPSDWKIFYGFIEWSSNFSCVFFVILHFFSFTFLSFCCHIDGYKSSHRTTDRWLIFLDICCILWRCFYLFVALLQIGCRVFFFINFVIIVIEWCSNALRRNHEWFGEIVKIWQMITVYCEHVYSFSCPLIPPSNKYHFKNEFDRFKYYYEAIVLHALAIRIEIWNEILLSVCFF